MFELDYSANISDAKLFEWVISKPQPNKLALDQRDQSWCEENLGYVPVIDVSEKTETMSGEPYQATFFMISFKSEDDAMLFKLACLN